jgi:type IV pilus assembly protein PilN
MRISLNLATRPYTDLGPVLKCLRIAMGVLLLLAIGLGLGLHAFHQKAEAARANEQSVQNQIDGINRERLGYQNMMRQPDNAQLLTQVAALNELFGEKSFSWTLAMEDLERVLPAGVQVTTLEPTRAKDGHITLRLRVIGPRNRAVDLVQNLEHSRYFLLPRIAGESSESESGPGAKLEPVSASNRVNFEVMADYNSTVPVGYREERKPEGEKPSADGAHIGRSALPSHTPHPLVPPAVPVKQPDKLSNTGSGQHNLHAISKPSPNRSLKPSPKSGGPR